jgi:hypothetical protein
MLNNTLMSAMDEETKNGAYCSFLYPIIKEELLTSYNWKSAVAYDSLICVETLNNNNLTYPYKFELPQNCLKVLLVNNANNFLKIGNNLFATSKDVKIIYIKNIDEQDFDSNLGYLLSIKLALELAYSLTLDGSLVSYLKALYQEKFAQFSNLDSKTGGNIIYTEDQENTTWINSHS